MNLFHFKLFTISSHHIIPSSIHQFDINENINAFESIKYSFQYFIFFINIVPKLSMFGYPSLHES